MAGIVERWQFSKPVRLNSDGGFLFNHPDGLAPVGLWIMPDNRSEGMLEDFIKAAVVAPAQSALLASAAKAVGALPSPLFKPIHTAKAEVATWLAWQKMPGQGMEATAGSELIDWSSARCQAFDGWLRTVFD